MKIGDIVFWEESNYMRCRLEKVEVVKVSSKFVTVKTTRNTEKKFNLQTMNDTGREYGRSHFGDTRYKLILPTPSVEHAFEIQTRREAIQRAVNTLYKVNVNDLEEELVNKYYNILQPWIVKGGLK